MNATANWLDGWGMRGAVPRFCPLQDGPACQRPVTMVTKPAA